nr:glutathione S-transferase family protein [Phaeobacter marinintestinus]
MNPTYRLYYAPDNASLIVRLVLEEMALHYDTCLVDRSVGAQGSAAYLALNPAGHIPTLITPDGPVSETAAILLWLADRHGQMAPSVNAPGRGVFLKWLFFASNTLQVGLRLNFYPEKYVGAEANHQAALRAQMQTVLPTHLTLLEQLANEGHDWFGSVEPSVLDYHIACCLRWSALYPDTGPGWFQLSDYPNLAALALQLEQRPAVATAQLAEGLGPTPFTAPQLCTPPEGSAF